MLWGELHFEHPWAFATLAIAPVIFWMAVRSYAYLPLGRRLGSAVIRVLALAALATALALPIVPEEDQRLCRAIAVDTSLSVPDEALLAAVEFVRNAEEGRGEDDTLVVLEFSGNPQFIDPGSWEALAKRAEGSGLQEQTDLLAAATYARSILPEDCSRRLVLISDGRDTIGDTERVEHGLEALG
ncbi:MAG: VWA domain-containing protein, partial [Deltaproteobacteria bacterium]|nr:VWA domain-containing protein [Deltaproteobacteria bacterium]